MQECGLPEHHKYFQCRPKCQLWEQCLFVYPVKMIWPSCHNERAHILCHHLHNCYSSQPMQMEIRLPAAWHTCLVSRSHPLHTHSATYSHSSYSLMCRHCNHNFFVTRSSIVLPMRPGNFLP